MVQCMASSGRGGGYQLANGSLVAVPANAPINNEFAVPNTAGTLAMVLAGSDINSATTQWFFNEVDNSVTLDPQLFTVFGEINESDTASFNVLNTIATVPVYTSTPLGTLFSQIPLINYGGGGAVQGSNYVVVTSIEQISPQSLLSTTISLTSSPNPSVFGQPVLLTSTVTPSAATGNVTFYDGVAVLGTAQLAGGQATFTTSLLPSGAGSLYAYYSGDANYETSTSVVVPQTVNAVAAAGFAPAKTYSVGSGPYAVAVGDF